MTRLTREKFEAEIAFQSELLGTFRLKWYRNSQKALQLNDTTKPRLEFEAERLRAYVRSYAYEMSQGRVGFPNLNTINRIFWMSHYLDEVLTEKVRSEIECHLAYMMYENNKELLTVFSEEAANFPEKFGRLMSYFPLEHTRPIIVRGNKKDFWKHLAPYLIPEGSVRQNEVLKANSIDFAVRPKWLNFNDLPYDIRDSVASKCISASGKNFVSGGKPWFGEKAITNNPKLYNEVVHPFLRDTAKPEIEVAKYLSEIAVKLRPANINNVILTSTLMEDEYGGNVFSPMFVREQVLSAIVKGWNRLVNPENNRILHSYFERNQLTSDEVCFIRNRMKTIPDSLESFLTTPGMKP